MNPMIEATAERTMTYDGERTEEVSRFYVKLYRSIRDTGFLAQVSGNGLKVLVAIATYIDTEGESWPSEDTLSRDTGMHLNTVKRCLAELQEIGAISVTQKRRRGGQWSSNQYSLSPDEGHFRFGHEPQPQHKVCTTVASPQHKSCTTVDEPEHKVCTTVGPPQHKKRSTVKQAINKNHIKQEPLKSEKEPIKPEKEPPGSLSSLWEETTTLAKSQTVANAAIWFRHTTLESLDDGVATVTCRNEAEAEMLSKRLYRLLSESLAAMAGCEYDLEFRVDKPRPAGPDRERMLVEQPGHSQAELDTIWKEVCDGFRREKIWQTEMVGSRLVGIRHGTEGRHATVQAKDGKEIHESWLLPIASAIATVVNSDTPFTVELRPGNGKRPPVPS